MINIVSFYIYIFRRRVCVSFFLPIFTAIFHSKESLPTAPYDGRYPWTACGVEQSGMTVLGKLTATTAGQVMQFTVKDVKDVETVAVVATRPGGYKVSRIVRALHSL